MAPLPIFGGGNDYILWQKQMKTFFISKGLWDLVQSERIYEAKEEARRDAQALSYIQQAVDRTIFSKIVSFSSAKTAWDFLEAEYNTKFLLEDGDFRPYEPQKGDCRYYPSYDSCREVPISIGHIYEEVRRELRELNPAVYTPQLISIGPLHHGRPELANMQIRKLYHAKCFLNRTEKQKEFFVGFIKHHEESIRHCYCKHSKLSSREYVEMILLDSFFILEFFHNPYDSLWILGEVQYWKNIMVDLMLFENQLPLILLFEIYKIAFGENIPRIFIFVSSSTGVWTDFSDILTSFSHLCSENFKVFENLQTNLDGEETSLDGEEVMKQFHFTVEEVMKQFHFTGLVRRIKCSGMPEEFDQFPITSTLKYSARKLSQSKVRFFGIVRGSLTDIRFAKRVLHLPKFRVDNTTERVYGNLIGLEESDYREFREKGHICSYILLLQHLMKNSDDVAVLVEDRVIINELGSNQAVVDMLNRLLKNVTIRNFYFSDLCGELNDYCSSRKGFWNYCMKLLKDVYFNNIWRGTATVVVILLFLTLTQTVTSNMQVM